MKKHHFELAQFCSFKIFFTFLLSLFFTCNAHALLPYKYSWITIKTPHFTVVVTEDLKDYGQSVANKAEEAFKRLEKLTNKHPKNTYIIVDHTKGFSNGSATFFPYPIIRLQPVTPDSIASVGQYKDWLLELLIHEYTHILTFHNTKGLYTPLRWLLGSTVSPGYFQPTWYQEGFAVYTESHLSNGGRLRSATYNAFKDELKAFNVAIANEQTTNLYPFGSAPYIYGGWLNQNLLGTNDLKSASDIHHRLSGRLPYTINGAYKKTSKKSVYKSWRELFSRKKKVKFEPKSEDLGMLPFWDKKNETLYFTQLDPFLFHKVIKQNANKESSNLFKARNIIQLKVQNNDVYYLSLRVHQRDHQVYSLYKFNEQTKTNIHLKTDENIKGFDIDGNKLALVTASLKHQNLYILKDVDFTKPVDLQTAQLILKVDGETRIGLPTFQGQNNLIYSLKKPAQGESAIVQSLESGTPGSTLVVTNHINDIEYSDNITWILHEKNGQKYISKIPTKASDASTIPVLSGIQQIFPSSNNKLFTSTVSHKGFFISENSLSKIQKRGSPLSLPQVEDFKLQASKNFDDTKTYSSFTKLRPHYINPNFVASPYGFSGEFLFGVGTGGQDPLGLHAYTLSATTDSITNEVSYGLDYTSNHFRLPINLNAGVFYEPITLDFFTKSTYAKLSTAFPLSLGFANNLNFTLSALINTTTTELPATQDTDGDGEPDAVIPGQFVVIENKRAGVSANFTYNRSEQRMRELAPRKGYSLALGATHYAETGEFFGYTQSFIGLRKFFTSPLNKTHRLILGVDGRVNDSRLPGIFASNSQNQLYRNVGLGGFALRGLPTSSVSANDSFVVGHLEYRFPVVNINWGPGLLPGFFQRVTGALSADYGSVKGFDRIRGVDLDHSTPLYSAGAELVFEGNAFYHVPASLQVGVYKFLNTDVYDSSAEVFIGFGLSGLPF